jgi:hypothetical protein
MSRGRSSDLPDKISRSGVRAAQTQCNFERRQEMPGQAGNPSSENFDVSELRVVELGTSDPNNIVDVGESFQLKARIEGSGSTWNNLKATDHKVRAQFYAEGMGPGVPNQSFGEKFADISGDDFWVTSDPDDVAHEGIYRCGVVVTIWDDAETNAWKGWLGFNEECPLQVNPHEE